MCRVVEVSSTVFLLFLAAGHWRQPPPLQKGPQGRWLQITRAAPWFRWAEAEGTGVGHKRRVGSLMNGGAPETG